MGLSIIHPTSSSSTILAEIALAQNQDLQDSEQLILSEEMLDPEMFKELFNATAAKGPGFLRGNTELYTCVLQESTTLSQLFSNQIKESNFQHKECDSKLGGQHWSFKETLTSQKELQLQDVHSEGTDQTSRETMRQEPSCKTQMLARQILENARLPESVRTLKETPALKQQLTLAKSIEHKIVMAAVKKEHADASREKQAVKSENKAEHARHEKSKESDRAQHLCTSCHTHTKESKEQGRLEQRGEEEEGFADKDREQQNYEESNDQSSNRHKVAKIDESYEKEFADYAAQESILSELFNLRVNQFDVLILFIEILKLEIRSREQERIARKQERELQLLYMQNVMENYKSQGKWMMFSSLGSGILAIVSGLCPIVNHMKGDWILRTLSGFFSSLRKMDQDQFFKGITKITFSMSEMQKSTGQIHNTFAEGTRTFDQHMSDLHRMDWEENTRTMEDIKDSWKSIENFLYQALQMYHDTIRQLYN